MGTTGSLVSKAKIPSSLLGFTKYTADEISNLVIRADDLFPDQYTLSKNDLHELLGVELFVPSVAYHLFDTVFCKDIFNNKMRSHATNRGKTRQDNAHMSGNETVDSYNQIYSLQRSNTRLIADKYEVICAIILLSKNSAERKLEFLFNLFDFNKKGYLLKEEVQLLIMSLMHSIFIIDDSLLMPTKEFCDSITKVTMDNHSETVMSRTAKVLGVKRRSLSNMILENSSMSNLFLVFQGHSSQIILATNEIWRDDAFPASYTSINLTTSSKNVVHMPPVDLIQWKRYSESTPKHRTVYKLFTHTTRSLKTADRIVVYQGPGILGEGAIRSKCLLANKWFQNSLALLATKPTSFVRLFLLTNQENQGIYCVQFYESISWRLVYCDNRVPCGIDGEPLFLASADQHEYCLMILEKALAKYLGSYSHIAKCSLRPDSLLMSLRMLTGGHVFTEVVSRFEWSSGYVLPSNQNGLKFIDKELKQGSIIGFIRSEDMLTHPSSVSRPPHQRFPCGFIYPLLGIATANEKKYFVFKDSWHIPGLAQNHSQNQDIILGQMNTFRLQVEEIPLYFNAFVMSTYPDLNRSSTQSGWQNYCVEYEKMHHSKPAVFALRVEGEPVDDQATLTASNSSSVERSTALEISITFSSSLPWGVAGDPKYRARTMIIMVPAYDTRIFLEQLMKDSSSENDHCLNKDLEFIHVINSSCASCRIKVFPGTYYIFANILFDASVEDLHRITRQHESVRNHFAWVESADKISMHASSFGKFSISAVKDEDIPVNNINFDELVNEPTQRILSLFHEDQSACNSSGVIDMLFNLYNQRLVIKAEMDFVRSEISKLGTGYNSISKISPEYDSIPEASR